MKPFGIDVISAERRERVEHIAKEDCKCRRDTTSNQGEDKPEYESRQVSSSRETKERFPARIAFRNILFDSVARVGSLAFGQHFGEIFERHVEDLI